MKDLLTGDNKTKFEKWYQIDYLKIPDDYITTLEMELEDFYEQRFEMQIGVLLAYYDSLGIIIILRYDRLLFRYKYTIKHVNKEFIFSRGKHEKSRNEAYKEAFLKVNDIVNKTN